jgi:membrane protein YdbS with pleckstrin-like domain
VEHPTAAGPSAGNLADVSLLPLSPAIAKVWTIKSGIAALLISGAAAVYDLASVFTGRGLLPLGLLTVCTAVVTFALAFGIPRLRYRFWRYRLRSEELLIERGIFNRVRTVVPLRRIQHLDVSQDVIEREFKLGKLIVHTAGTRSSDVVLPGLDIDEANRLRDAVKHYILEDAV